MSYVNPVYAGSCPDPFVLKFCGGYYCYSTGRAPDGKAFEVLHSRDLIHWRSLGGAMVPLFSDAPEYWAPEVTYANGRFFLYYSVGDGVQMRLRVAVASAPEGPFQDSGRLLTGDDFAIDAHVFEDEDGSRFLFYAKDFLDHTHIGTGTVVDRMIDELTLEGNPRPVSLPRFDWQVFDPNRVEKGGVRWHTVEGPFVLKYKGRYYQMFSGGNWKNITYGVSYAVADSMGSQQEWIQLQHDENLPLVMATIPGKVIGPGHNSAVLGPDHRQLFCAYHRWAADQSARLLCVDRLEWIGDRLSVLGPSTMPQDDPNAPKALLFQPVSGIWDLREGELIQRSAQKSARSETQLRSQCFAMELNAAALAAGSGTDPDSGYGFTLAAGEQSIFEFALRPGLGVAVLFENGRDSVLQLQAGFSFDSYHLLRIDLDGRRLNLRLDGRPCWRGDLDGAPDRLALFSEGVPCSFKACSLTYGFEDNFYGPDADPGRLGWIPTLEKSGKWRISGGEMQQIDSNALNSVLVKVHPFTQHELVVNARLISGGSHESCYGFYPALTESGGGPLIRVEERENRPYLAWYSQQGNGAWQLPDGFDRSRAQQFRFRKQNGLLQVYQEAEPLGSLEAPRGPARAALYANRARVSFDLVRLTSLDLAAIEGSCI